jgi:uncharacterized RDD family membrane protein YckC
VNQAAETGSGGAGRSGDAEGEEEVLMSTRTLELKAPVDLAAGGTSLSRRAAAFGMDLVLIATISLAVSIGLHLLLLLFAPALLEQERWVIAGAFAACSAAYFLGFWTREGSTPGQHIMGLRLALMEYRDNPGPIGMPRAIVRFATMVGSGILLLDFIVAFLHRERRSLHDLAAGTIVVSVT